MKISDFVFPGNFVELWFYRQGYLYYLIRDINYTLYQFQVSTSDFGCATANKSEKAIDMMVHIAKAISRGTMVKR